MKQSRPRLVIGMFALLGLLVAFQASAPTSRPVVSAQSLTVDLAQELTTTYPFYQNEAIAQAVAYLQTQQAENGGINSFTFGADPGGTIRVILTLNAVGYPANTLVSSTDNTLLDYLEAEVISYIYQADTPATANLFPGRAGQLLAAVAAAGADPASFGGVDLIAALNAAYAAAGDGTYSTPAEEGFSSGEANDINQTLAILGLISAGQPIPEAATTWLINNQNEGGSWSNDLSITGYAIVALIGSGNVFPTDPAIRQALAFYRENQTAATALWGDIGMGEPANSTGWAMTALATAGFIPTTQTWATGGTNPREALVGLQTDEGIIAGRFFNAYATLEALYGLTDQPLFMTTPLRVERALAYMQSRQNDDGGWPGFAAASSPGETLDNLLAFVAAGYNPNTITSATDQSPLDYLATAAGNYTRDDSDRIFPTQTGKLIVGVVASGGDPTGFGSPTPFNLVTDLTETLQATGAYSTTASRGFATGAAGATPQSFAILGLVAAGETIPAAATDFLISLQDAEGSWGSADTTGLALQALIAAGIPANNAAVQAGITALRESQSATGGWEAFGAFSTNSTAYAIQGLLAAGVDLTEASWRKDGRWPLGTLGSYQKPDGPFVTNWNYADITDSFNPTADNLFATQQAVPALLEAFYPYTGTAVADPATTYTPIPRGPDPDRLVAGAAFGIFSPDGESVAITVPYGSDLNGDGTLTLEWSVAEDGPQVAAFEAVDTIREIGYFSATIDLSGRDDVTPTDTLLFRATFTDGSDGVQNGGTLTTDPTVVESREEPLRVYLPIVGR